MTEPSIISGARDGKAGQRRGSTASRGLGTTLVLGVA